MNTIIRIFSVLVLWLLATLAHAGTHHYYYTDPQGTPLAKADASGAIIATYDYAPYGAAVVSMSPAPNGPGYTGHVNDPDTGLVYMQARYYDPAVGRFLSTDPVDPAAGNIFNFNRYAYANNNPVVNVDPDGRATDPTEETTEGRVETPGDALRDVMNESSGKGMVAQIRAIDPTYQLPSVSGPQGGPYYTEVTNGILSSDLSNLQKNGPPQCVAPGADGEGSGSYTNIHESGKTYSGKGPTSRSQVSARKVESENGDKHVATEWTHAATAREAFKQESDRIDANGGSKSDRNYNKIASPGKKIIEQDKSHQ